MNMASAPAARPEKILLVEDDEFSIQLIEMYLRKAGFTQLTTAQDGREALELARSNHYDLILLDLNLPRLNGPEVLRRLRKNDALKRTSVLVISSLTNTEATANCMELGAEDYLPKPFNKQLLESRAISILDRRRLQRELAEATARQDKAVAAARQMQAAALDALRADPNAAAAHVVVPGGEFLGTVCAVRPVKGGRVVLCAEAATPGLEGGLAALSAPALLDVALAEGASVGEPEALLQRLERLLAAAAEPAGGLKLALAMIDPCALTVARVGSDQPECLVLRASGGVETLRPGAAASPYEPGDRLILAGTGVGRREALADAVPFGLRGALASGVGRPDSALMEDLKRQMTAGGAALPADAALILLQLPTA